MKVLITGATGFIGKHLLRKLVNEHEIIALGKSNVPEVDIFFSADLIDNKANFYDALNNVDIVIHCAGKTPSDEPSVSNTLADYMDINCQATQRLAKASAESGVKRFIFLSTAKVNGEFSNKNRPFKLSDSISPQEPYSISKAEAEKALLEISKETDMDIVIIRPPLVYGVGMKCYFDFINKLISVFFPLPFAAVDNKRSFVSVNNLVDLMLVCMKHPNAANKTFYVSDDSDISTPELIRLLASGKHSFPILFPFPIKLLKFFSCLIGKKKIMAKLCGDFQLDISNTKCLLSWEPVVNINDELKSLF